VSGGNDFFYDLKERFPDGKKNDFWCNKKNEFCGFYKDKFE
jgi:hypothetical protein